MAALPAALEADVARIGRLDSIPDVLELMAQLTGMRFAAVARVTDRHWIACRTYDRLGFGLQAGDTLPLEFTFCDQICRNGQPIFFGHAAADPQWHAHPIPAHYGFQSYLSVPIRLADGSIFGTLCALDPEPRAMDVVIVGKAELLAQLVGQQLMAEARAADSAQASLAAWRQAGKAGASAQLRGEFIGILAHDLRNPLLSMRATVDMLALDELNQRQAPTLRALQRSLLRMEELIDFALDFAQGSDPGCIALDYDHGDELQEALLQVIEETHAAYAAQVLSVRVAIDEPVHCDAIRIAQVLGSLTINAIVHGQPESLITIDVRSGNGWLDLQVVNLDGIAPVRLAALQASARPQALDRPTAGTELGLHMAAEIARAHHGGLEIAPATDGTRFAMRIPTGARHAESSRAQDGGVPSDDPS